MAGWQGLIALQRRLAARAGYANHSPFARHHLHICILLIFPRIPPSVFILICISHLSHQLQQIRQLATVNYVIVRKFAYYEKLELAYFFRLVVIFCTITTNSNHFKLITSNIEIPIYTSSHAICIFHGCKKRKENVAKR